MQSTALNIVLWCNDAPNQRALAWKVSEKFNLTGIVVEQKANLRQLSFQMLIKKIIHKLFFYPIDHSWKKLMDHYSNKFHRFPETEILYVNNINSDETTSFMQKLQPGVIIVSGTSLIKTKLLQLKPRFGILNLHTGLSPYMKGGPNCTNWCLANNEFYLIGNTVMWIDEGIDSGNIISTRLVDFDGNENLFLIHLKVMEEAHKLYLDVLQLLHKDVSLLPNVKQKEISEGKIFFSKMWNWKAKRNLLKNLKRGKFRKTIQSDDYKFKLAELKTVALP